MTRTLTKREKQLLSCSVVALLGWAVLSLAILPLREEKDDSLTRIRKANAIADLLASESVADIPEPAQQPLSSVLTRRADTAGIGIRRLEPVGEAITVTLDDAPYASVIGWMATLTEEDGLRIASVDMARRTAPGTVAARLTLEPTR
ncbi:type II secretion system protein M [Roseobacter sp. YSTF-M11]|uniref:Type II secretion system protein M n=1 Tax=Roseobacter insulae TaxID=2859783 RepID=A0A9X1K1F3_9RHOB|nr:type II secretion system protein GspM [Roseobacter insulae]MBW4707428.1 type II secretion system protein M [Roseobacter insulae]